MREIIKYQTEDGKEFDTRLEAAEYEALLEEVEKAKKIIVQQPDSNSSVGLPNSSEDVNKFMEAFRVILVRHLSGLLDKWDANPRGVIGRYLSDGGSPVYSAVNRLYYNCVLCVGKDNKSYGQPYFAYNTWR